MSFIFSWFWLWVGQAFDIALLKAVMKSASMQRRRISGMLDVIFVWLGCRGVGVFVFDGLILVRGWTIKYICRFRKIKASMYTATQPHVGAEALFPLLESYILCFANSSILSMIIALTYTNTKYSFCGCG